MLEKIIENWLDKASEKSFQQPFCYMLSAEGHTIIHSTKHSATELGKDIITIDPDGTPCAFQLKAGNISLTKWRKEVSPQIEDLVVVKILHSSVDSPKHHKSFLVTNGNIAEEVSIAIKGRNETWASQGQSYLYLKTLDRGELFDKAKKIGIGLWPSELTDTQALLEMFMENGKGVLPKNKLWSLFESLFSLDSEKALSAPHRRRIIASAALLCTIAISSFSKEKNHVAEIEGWTLYIAYVLAIAEKWGLSVKTYKNELKIATDSIYNSLANLCDEIKEREELIEGDFLADPYIYRVRITWLLGLMGIYALWRRRDGVPKGKVDDFLREFCKEKRHLLELWGEAVIPQFLAFFWYFRKIDATPEPDFRILCNLISSICKINHPNTKIFLANPYYEAEETLPHRLAPVLGSVEDPLEDIFTGKSYTLEGLVHLFVRRNWKQTMKSLWPDVTRLEFISFEPANFCEFYRWRSEKGTNKIVYPKHTQDWEELKELSCKDEGVCIPPTIKGDPILLLLFLCVYPHRMNAEIMRWLDTQMKDIQMS